MTTFNQSIIIEMANEPNYWSNAECWEYWDRNQANCLQQEEKNNDEKYIAWMKYFSSATREEAYENYINCKYHIKFGQDIWSQQELECFKQNIHEYECTMQEEADERANIVLDVVLDMLDMLDV